MTPPPHAIAVLGATSAIARAIANRYAKEGHLLIIAARDADEAGYVAADLRIRHGVEATALAWDAGDYDSHAAFVEDCVNALGENLGGVVLCSGCMDEQERAQSDVQSARRTFDVNLTGSVSTLNLFANLFEERGAGFIAAIGSVAGDRGRQSNYIYGASKAGLSAYLEGLRNRLYHSGVHVVTIKPGFVDTKMTWGKVPFAASPEDAAAAIVRAIEKKKNVVYVPWFWRYIMLIIRWLPERLFKRLKL